VPRCLNARKKIYNQTITYSEETYNALLQ
jgi:hypothetical protein